jgi:guanylate kinase
VKSKVIIVSAPSGAGKTSVVRHLLSVFPELEFSVSACSRPRRDNETEGKDYYFMTQDEFRDRIGKEEFVEWQEVYPGRYYGTLRSELDRIWNAGKFPLFDLDVVGGYNMKNLFGEKALSLFIMPPSEEVLEKRLRGRNTETEESLRERIRKARYELTFTEKSDVVILNEVLENACAEAERKVRDFLPAHEIH